MQININSTLLDQMQADYESAEAALQALDQEFRAICAASTEPVEQGGLTLIERMSATLKALPAVVVRRDELSTNMSDLEAFTATIATHELVKQHSTALKELDKRVQALSEQIRSSVPMGGYSGQEQVRRQLLVNQYGSGLVNEIEERIRTEVSRNNAALETN